MTHPKKEIAAAVEYARNKGWRIVEGGPMRGDRCIVHTTTRIAGAESFAERVSGVRQKAPAIMRNTFVG